MTPEEKHAQMMTRNAEIVAYYLAGHSLAQCSSHFQLGRQRTLQILKKSNVWKPYVKTSRTQFLGVTVSEETKDALRQRAEEEGISVSKLVSDALDEAVTKS
jgi:predicted HicB family RNase H-like nuclease